MKRLLGFLFLLLASVPYIFAQGTISSLPSCALTCLVAGLETSTCAPTNTTCVCLDVTLQEGVAVCVAKTCTIKESLIAKNVTQTTCKAPIRDVSSTYYSLSITFGVISSAIVLVRLSTRFITQASFGLDDLFIFITLVVGVPSSILTVHGIISNGLGKDIWTLTPKEITDFIHVFYGMEILYFLQVTLLKLSLLFFYLRIFPGPNIKRLIWGTIILDICFGFLFVLLAIFQCRPINFYWNSWDGEHQGRCLNVNVLGWSNAGISIVLDLWMLALPMSQLFYLKLHWKKKIGVAMMFIVGTFVTVISIIRLQSLVHFATSVNPTWDNLPVSIWSTVEINIGIICTCMPSLRLLLVRLFPKIMGSTQQQSRTGNHYYSTQNHTANGGNISVVRPRGKSAGQNDTGIDVSGITYEQSYTVHHGDQWDQDESKLIAMSDLESESLKSPPKVSVRSVV